jgi:hypothetical protein
MSEGANFTLLDSRGQARIIALKHSSMDFREHTSSFFLACNPTFDRTSIEMREIRHFSGEDKVRVAV